MEGNLLGSQLSSIVTVTKPAVVTETPGEQVTIGDDCSAVRAATRDVTYPL